ncbi:MAG: hypothetical protein HUU55_04915 [Myxococcales bacterium]|nr:hypothetical protein [Myxococcales bacterium]
MDLRSMVFGFAVLCTLIGGCIGNDGRETLFDTSTGQSDTSSSIDDGINQPTDFVNGDEFGSNDIIAAPDTIDPTDTDTLDAIEPNDGGSDGSTDIFPDDAAVDSDDSLLVPDGPGLMGVLVDENEVPLEKVKVLACMAKTCFYGESGINGFFSFQIEPPAEIALKTLGNLTATPKQGAALVPLVLTDDQLVDCGMVYVPLLPEGVQIGPKTQDPQTVEVGSGLVLTLSRADIKMPPGEILTDVAATQIPQEQIPALPALPPDEQVVAMYALHPFSAKSTSPISVKAPSSLPNGTPVLFRTISSLDGLLSDPIAGKADGQWVSTPEDQGIYELTRIVITTPGS